MTVQWRLAGSLLVLLNEVNKRWPDRDKASDGTIGDAAHASRQSDHNPNAAGVVRALDVDAGPGLNPDEAHDTVGDHVTKAVIAAAKAGHPAMGPGSYVIHEGKIASANSAPPWSWRDYTGSDQHTSHPHISVALSERGYDSTRPWGLWPKPVPPIDHPPAPQPENAGRPPTIWMRMSKRRAERNKHWVRVAQRRLGVTDDGIFGPVTRRHVVAFRKAHHIRPARTGVIGGRTWKAMGVTR